MIISQLFINYLLAALIFSFEATVGLPFISLFIVFKQLDRLDFASKKDVLKIFLGLIVTSFSIAIFYSISLSWTVLAVFLYYFLRDFFGLKFFKRNRLWWQILQVFLFIFLQTYILFLAQLNFNLFFLLQLILAISLAFLRKRLKF